jgi:hypothetical protein
MAGSRDALEYGEFALIDRITSRYEFAARLPAGIGPGAHHVTAVFAETVLEAFRFDVERCRRPPEAP